MFKMQKEKESIKSNDAGRKDSKLSASKVKDIIKAIDFEDNNYLHYCCLYRAPIEIIKILLDQKCEFTAINEHEQVII